MSGSIEWGIMLQHLTEPDVSEVTTNGPTEFFIKKAGKRIKVPVPPLTEASYLEGIEQGLIPFVREIIKYERGNYLFEGPLHYPYGDQVIRGRVHIVLPPCSDNPQVTIAKKSTSLISLDAIAERGSMSTEMLKFLKVAMHCSLTLVFSGGTGAGKTTMLEACGRLIPPSVRIGVAEDAPELNFSQPNVTYLHSVPWRPGMDPNSVATLSWVVQQYQRMRTDRLVIGETRGREFADFLIAANSGMEGSMTTIHANDPDRCLAKMTNFALKAGGDMPTRVVNVDIANAIDIIVQLIILPNGKHKVGAIQEVSNTIAEGADARIATTPLYEYDKVTDRFFKRGLMSDQLRARLEAHNVDMRHFRQTPVGTPMDAHYPRPATSAAHSSQVLPPSGRTI